MRIRNQDEVKQIIEMYRDDMMSSRQIAKELGISKSKVADIILSSGISRERSHALKNAVSSGYMSIKSGRNNPRYKNGWSMDNSSGIYLLYDNSELVYIGKSNSSIMQRIQRHITDESKEFNNAVVVDIESDSDIHIAEIYLINKYRPIYNIDSLGDGLMTIEISNMPSIMKRIRSLDIVDGYIRNIRSVAKECPCMDMDEFRELIDNGCML